jgi:hypothetical protein
VPVLEQDAGVVQQVAAERRARARPLGERHELADQVRLIKCA